VSINTGICLSVVVLAATAVAASAADLEFFKGPAPIVTPTGPQTLTGDWFGQGPAMRAAGLDVRLEWSQFYQGLLRGEGDKRWRYGGKWDAQVRADLSRLGFWNGLSVTGQGQFNYGHSVNGIGGALLPVNTALMFPGIEGADRSDIMALFATQHFGDLVSLRVGKLNLLEFPRATPLRGGGGIDTFWNINLAAPITGLIPPTLNGAMLGINTQPVSFSFMVFDPQDATNRPLFSDLFENGISFMGTATLQTTIAGLTGFYGIRALYSSREGPDFSEVIRPPGTPVNTKQGSYYVGASFQQYLIQDPSNPAKGWAFLVRSRRPTAIPTRLSGQPTLALAAPPSFPAGRSTVLELLISALASAAFSRMQWRRSSISRTSQGWRFSTM
jgi:porin